MARSSTFPYLTIHMILLLVGFLLISVPLYTHYPSFGGPVRVGSSSTHSRILTEESPVFRFNVTPPSPSVEISSLHSNDTPVALLVRGSTNVLLNATNITSLEGYPVEVAKSRARPMGRSSAPEVRRKHNDYSNLLDLLYYSLRRLQPSTLLLSLALSYPSVVLWG